MVDYNHKLYERAAKKAAYWNEGNIDMLKISIEGKMETAQEKKKQIFTQRQA